MLCGFDLRFRGGLPAGGALRHAPGMHPMGGLYDCDDLKDAEPGALRPALEPARPAGPPRPRPRAEDQPDLAVEGRLPDLLAAAIRPACTRLTSQPVPATRKEAVPAQSEPVPPEHLGQHRRLPGTCEPDITVENRHHTISN